MCQMPDLAGGLASRLRTQVQTPDPKLAAQIIRDSSGLTAMTLRIASGLRRQMGRGDAR